MARTTDVSRSKQFRSGITQLGEEGVIQVLHDPDFGEQAPVLAAVGALQFDVARYRLETEFKAPVEFTMTRYKVARRTDAASRDALRAMQGVNVLERTDGVLLAVFESVYWLERLETQEPELTLDRLVAAGELRQ